MVLKSAVNVARFKFNFGVSVQYVVLAARPALRAVAFKSHSPHIGDVVQGMDWSHLSTTIAAVMFNVANKFNLRKVVRHCALRLCCDVDMYSNKGAMPIGIMYCVKSMG